MKKLFLVSTATLILTAFTLWTGGQDIIGKYSSLRKGYNYSSIDVRQDGTYSQEVYGFDSIATDGRWKIKADTLMLDIKKIYAF